jgi:predicted regulator of Ras-like GTPase activity (Roadblock/LC7/MglB family)
MDASVVQALRMVRDAVEELSDVPEEKVLPGVFEGLEDAQRRLLLSDRWGRVLGGGMHDEAGDDASDDVAAHASLGAKEAERTARLLDLGDWNSAAIEGPGGNLHLSRPNEDSLLVVARDRSVPVGRLSLLAEKASEVAREWLEEQHL